MARHHAPRTPTSPDSAKSPATATTPGAASTATDSINTAAVLARLAKAKEIESALESLAAEQKASKRGGGGSRTASDEKCQAVRLQLCEVLSEVILHDPAVAEANDAINRLWKHCFYGRINDIRSRIMKEKSRAKKRQFSGGEAEESRKRLGEYERQLKQFLKEAIQLYKYIVERYVRELMPLSQSQLSGVSDLSQQHEEERAKVVVASLYRMHIHLGDLYRYSTSYNPADHKLAEECYLKAATLAPGTGNPYNQLAVVAQQSQENQTAVALYYYARSLLATLQPFETSRSNLVRLFESNRKWIEEHARDDDHHARGILNVSDMEKRGNAGVSHKARKEWMQKERAAMNRKALARLVDLQWDFFRGVSLDGADADKGKIDLDGLMRKMASIHETLGNLLANAAFGEALLCKLVAALAFSTLGAGNSGKLMNSDGFYAKRRKDPTWKGEGIVATNQALALSFLLRLCATLAKEVDGYVAKKEAVNSAHKLGSIRSLPPLLLGFQFANSIYDGCEWFHGLSFYPTDGNGGEGLEGNSIRRLCTESHAEFWRAVAQTANRLEGLPRKKKRTGPAEVDVAEVKEFAEFRGYVPFASFLDKASGDDDDDMAHQHRKEKEMKYAPADEALGALTESKSSGGGGKAATEMATNLKIDLFLSFAKEKTRPEVDGEGGGPHFLSKNSETDIWEYSGGTPESEEKASERQEDEKMESPLPSPIAPDMDEENEIEAKDSAVPLKMTYSEKGMALLTPAALLASTGGATNDGHPTNAATDKDVETKPSLGGVVADSILAPGNDTEPASNVNKPAAPTTDTVIDAVGLLDPAAFAPHEQQLAKKASLPPPPGFSMQPPPPAQPQLAPASSAGGISLANFAAPHQSAPQQSAPLGSNQAAMAPLGTGMLPQVGLANPSGTHGMFATMNPFAQGNYSGLNAPPGLLPGMAPSNVNNLQQGSNQNGLDPTLDSLLSNGMQPNMGTFGSSGMFNATSLPPAQQAQDPSESILNFLFDSNHDASEDRQPLYASQQHPTQQPQTKNPFAT